MSEVPPSYRRILLLLLILPIVLLPLSYWGKERGLWDGDDAVRYFVIGVVSVPLILGGLYLSGMFGAWIQKKASPLEPRDSKGDAK